MELSTQTLDGAKESIICLPEHPELFHVVYGFIQWMIFTVSLVILSVKFNILPSLRWKLFLFSCFLLIRPILDAVQIKIPKLNITAIDQLFDFTLFTMFYILVWKMKVVHVIY